MALTLYGIPESRAIRPLWAACELGLDFEHVPVPFEGGATRTPEFLSINPNGRIPALVDARGEAHLAAARFTVADLCVASVANWVRAAGMPLGAWPAVGGWLDACMDRPAYRTAGTLGHD